MMTLASCALVKAQEKPPLKLIATTPMPGFTGDFDHFGLDLKGNRLFLASEVQKTVEVFDLRTGERIHSIKGFGQPLTMAYLAESDRLVVPTSAEVPVLWLGTAERISAIVQMNHRGAWIMGDLADDDRAHGMGIVVEYARHKAKPVWLPPKPFQWSYARFAKPTGTPADPDEVIDMTFTKQNAAEHGFNLWGINDKVFSSDSMSAAYHLRQGKRYRIRMRNASDDIHPIHLHRHSFELT